MIYLIAAILMLAALIVCLGKVALPSEPVKRDPEFTLTQRDAVTAIDWAIFHTIAIYSSVSYWLRFKRICAWHEPKPIRMGGNPWARNVTHGMCPQCFARVSGEIASHDAKRLNHAA